MRIFGLQSSIEESEHLSAVGFALPEIRLQSSIEESEPGRRARIIKG